MDKEKKYKKDDIENENFLVSFYRNNKILVWLLIFVIIAIIVLKYISFGSNSNPSSENVKISIEPKSSVILEKGNTINLIASINVSNATIIWSSSDTNVVIVSNGIITGVNSGKASITATYIDENNNKHTATKDIEVINNGSTIDINSISFPEGDLYMPLNKEYQLNISTIPANAIITEKTFTSSNERVVTITNDGIVKSLSEGHARITVIVNGKYKSFIEVYVSKEILNSEIIVSPTTLSFHNSSRKIKVGNEEKLNYSILPSNADKAKLKWTSSNEKIVTVDNEGNIKARGEGKAVVTVSSINGKKDEITIEVYNDIVEVNDIILSVDEINMEAGNTEIITPIVTPDNASDKGLSYFSSDENVVTVTFSSDSTGAILSAINKGTATITITSGKIQKNLIVNVTGEGNNNVVDDDNPKLPTTIVVRSEKNNLAKSYEDAKKIPVAGETNVSIEMRVGVGKVKYCINKYGSDLCKPNIELYSNDVVKIPSGDVYVLRVIKYDYIDNEIESKSENYIDGVLNYYINTKSNSVDHGIIGAYKTSTEATMNPIKINDKVIIEVKDKDNYIKACATSNQTACTPSIKITNRYEFTLNASGAWRIIVNEYDKNNNQIGNSKIYYATVKEDEESFEYGNVKVSNLKIFDDNTNGKYLSTDVESNINFNNVRFCYKVVSKGSNDTCNLDLTSSSVPYSNNDIIRPKEELKTYYSTLSSTKKYNFKFYLDSLDILFKNNDTNKDVIFEFAVKSSKGFTTPIKLRISMTNKSGNSSSWKTTAIK